MSQHTIPKSIYYMIFGALMLLTATTVWIAFIDLGVFNDVVALGIATTKATLVILFFMHVRYSNKLVWAAVFSGFLFLAILLTITMSDYLTRGWESAPKPW